MIDLCFLHADFGDGFYRDIAERMTCSLGTDPFARTFVQFGDMKSEPIGGANRIVRADITPANMIQKRVETLKHYARTASNNMVLTDCDIQWRKSPAPVFDEDFDIGLCWRTGNPAMPYYGGFVFVRHGSEAAHQFLNEWVFTMATLPPMLHSFWGDQIALAAMLGRQKPNTIANIDGTRVKIFDAGRIFFNMKSREQVPPKDCYAIHWKGHKKELANAA